MGARTLPDGRSAGSVIPDLVIIGLGPGDLAFTDDRARRYLMDGERTVLLRTIDHPAAVQLADERPVETCDDLYGSSDDFESVYEAVASRALEESGVVRTGCSKPDCHWTLTSRYLNRRRGADRWWRVIR